MFVLARAVTYSAVFIGLLLIFLPDRILASTGIKPPAAIGAWQVVSRQTPDTPDCWKVIAP